MKKYNELKLFAIEIVSLISQGCQEEVNVIEDHIDNRDIIEYLFCKYGDRFSTMKDELPDSCLFVNLEDKACLCYGIKKENDGLLLIVSIIIDLLNYPFYE